MVEAKIRYAKKEDVDKLIDMVVRLKRLNEEFDPLLKNRGDVVEQAKKYLTEAVESENSLVLVAEYNGKLIGLVKADIRERLFYEPKTEGSIIELYVMPEYRRKGLGVKLIEKIMSELRNRGAELITAEFPSLNKIAVNFYEELKFRPIISIYAKEL